jgi:hypothetical protein
LEEIVPHALLINVCHPGDGLARLHMLETHFVL